MKVSCGQAARLCSGDLQLEQADALPAAAVVPRMGFCGQDAAWRKRWPQRLHGEGGVWLYVDAGGAVGDANGSDVGDDIVGDVC